MIGKRKRSIRGKLTGIIMVISTTAVLLACLGFTTSGLLNLRARRVADLSTTGQVIGANSTAALTFGDHQAAREVLGALRSKPAIVAACIYGKDGQPFAGYTPEASATIPRHLLPDGFHEDGDLLELYYPIRLDHERIGTLYLAADARDRDARLKQYGLIAGGIVLLSLLVAYVLAAMLQRAITEPIVELARVAELVSQHKNFSMRARHPGVDSNEIGNLMAGFNSMLAEIEQRDDRLLLHQTHLEQTVALRTSELTAANEELLVAKNAAERHAELNAQLARESALILNSATDGIFGLDVNSEPSFLNPAGVRMLGRGLADLQGQSIHELIHHSRADGTPLPSSGCPLGAALQRGEPLAVADDIFWRPDGTSFPVEYSATPMVDEEGRHQGTVLIFRDITERRAIERMKGEFVSTVSHELRTPLTSIRGALGLLSSGLLGPVAEKGQRMLEIAVTNTDRLVRLINDILDLERIEAGKVELASGPVDAGAVMSQAAEGLQTIADQAGIRLVVEPAAGCLWGDSDRIIQTLTNLLGNAIKFSPPDTTVTLSGLEAKADFTFCIADEGRGVPEQKLETIFERFRQVDASDSRDKGGSGLGLAICQSIVHAHGGRIWAEKNDPVGSRFRFSIPLAASRAVAGQAPPATKTILVCRDDSSPNVVGILENRGCHVVTASSPADVVARAVVVHPDAIILDLANRGDGRELVEALQSTAETCDVPVVLATGWSPEAYETYADTVANWVRSPPVSGQPAREADLPRQAPSILVVEDDLDLAGVMTTALHSRGLRTVHVARGADAIKQCQEHEPRLLVLDLTLPDMDGFAVVSALRERAALRRIPLIIYSAIDVGSADQARLRLGPTEFLTKSRCSMEDFEAHVVRLLETVTDRNTEGRHAAA